MAHMTCPPLLQFEMLHVKAEPTFKFLVALNKYLDLPRKSTTTVYNRFPLGSPRFGWANDEHRGLIMDTLRSLFRQDVVIVIAYNARGYISPLASIHQSPELLLRAAHPRTIHLNGIDNDPEWLATLWKAHNTTTLRVYGAVVFGFVAALFGRDLLLVDRDNLENVTAIIEELDISHVRTIHLTGFDDDALCASALREARNITTLRVQGGAANELVAALYAEDPEAASFAPVQPSDEDAVMATEDGTQAPCEINEPAAAAGRTPSRALFPNLRVLQIVDCTLSALGGSTQSSLLDVLHWATRDYGLRADSLAAGLRLPRTLGAVDRVEFEREVWWDRRP
ncbi:hypothetical protein C8Q80DRAFT_1268728 [Daedaleopsis nitida]|nr:hypothetical protein C8Q80DRAFT_1268728 [Daedaleopsis nitida]